MNNNDNTNVKFEKMLRNVMRSDEYRLLMDGMSAVVYEQPDGRLSAEIIFPAHSLYENLHQSPCCWILAGATDFVYESNYVCCTIEGERHEFEFVKDIDASELLK